MTMLSKERVEELVERCAVIVRQAIFPDATEKWSDLTEEGRETFRSIVRKVMPYVASYFVEQAAQVANRYEPFIADEIRAALKETAAPSEKG